VSVIGVIIRADGCSEVVLLPGAGYSDCEAMSIETGYSISVTNSGQSPIELSTAFMDLVDARSKAVSEASWEDRFELAGSIAPNEHG
jgi:hypothetical protein